MRIKICGITNHHDALAAATLGADALGFNFYARSPRCIAEKDAAAILPALPPFIEPVALFAEETFANMMALARRLHLRTLQFHGENFAPCPNEPFRFIPAFAIRGEQTLCEIVEYVARCRSAGQLPAAVLIDGHAADRLGGTGKQAPWDLLAGFDSGVPLILAGGLTPENVALAVRRVRPFAVDVASGVETSPGRKDLEKMRRFIAEARGA